MSQARQQNKGGNRGGAHWQGKGGRGRQGHQRNGQENRLPVAQLLLYREAGQAILGQSLSTGNAGLWWNKFCAGWTMPGEAGKPIIEVNKLRWVEPLTNRTVGDAALLAEMHERRLGLIKARAGQCYDAELGSRLVTGLGLEHPIENGFAWHHSLGVPYLAGAAVKGVTRAYVENWLNLDGDDKAQAARIFGGASDGAGAGSVIFLDGLPTRPVRLTGEVATPHIGRWLQTDRPSEHPPADWVDPNPIPFLTMERGQALAFVMLPRRIDGEEDCKTAKRWLMEALAEIGAGAKTAVGYGLFSPQGETVPAVQTIRSPWLSAKNVSGDAPRNRPPTSTDRPTATRTPVRVATPGGFQIDDDVALKSDRDVEGKVLGFEDGKVLVDFEGDQEALAADSLIKLT